MRLKLVWELRGCCVSIVSIVSIAQDHDECPSPCGYYSQHAEMSWRTALAVLTLLTVLTLVARFSTPELIS
jgi:hypothetical protein